MELTQIYSEYTNLVNDISRKFKKKYGKNLGMYEVEDLTQSCWEQICKKYMNHDPNRGKMSTYINLLCRSTLSNILRDQQAVKRKVNQKSIELSQCSNDIKDQITGI